jgi:hypothetical protein
MTTKTRLLTIGLATALLVTSAVGAFASPGLTLGHGPVVNVPGSGIYRGPIFPGGGSDPGLHRGPVYPVGFGPSWPPYGGGGDWWWWNHHHHHHHHHHHEYPL